jgi:hypothetical protein
MSHPNGQGYQGRDGAAGQPGGQAQAVRRELWLDLEDTVVTPAVNGFDACELINIEKVRQVIAEFQPDAVSIFSFAIWHVGGLQDFNARLRKLLENALGVRFSIIPTVDDHIIPACCGQLGLFQAGVDFQEMSNFWGKQGAFRLYARQHADRHLRHHPNLGLHMLLLDDVVYNEMTYWPDMQTAVEQRNIDLL